jgi:hypothetical protein
MVVYVVNTINVVKKRVKFGRKRVDWMLKHWPQTKKMFVLQFWPPANVRDLTNARVYLEAVQGASKSCWVESNFLTFICLTSLLLIPHFHCCYSTLPSGVWPEDVKATQSNKAQHRRNTFWYYIWIWVVDFLSLKGSFLCGHNCIQLKSRYWSIVDR